MEPQAGISEPWSSVLLMCSCLEFHIVTAFPTIGGFAVERAECEQNSVVPCVEHDVGMRLQVGFTLWHQHPWIWDGR